MDTKAFTLAQRFDVSTLNTNILTPSISRPMRCDDLAYKPSDASGEPNDHILRDIQFLILCNSSREGDRVCVPGLSAESGMRVCTAMDISEVQTTSQ